MSDETSKTEEPETTPGGEAPSEEDAAASEEPPRERVDEDGLPLDRDATIDDVRSKEGQHGRIAMGCTLAIVLVLVLFWLIRGGVIG